MTKHQKMQIIATVSLFLIQVSCFQLAPTVLKSTPSKAWTAEPSPFRHGPSSLVSTSRTSSGRASRANHCFQLHSLKSVVDEIVDATEKQTIFVGGKGGVGKTTTSAALAVELAMRDLKVLVVSTDPAHSLGDALDEDLRVGNGQPITMTDPLTAGRLDACEISAEAALDDFRESLAGFDVERLANSMGVSADLLESLGLREFSGLLNTPPPGLDELVALGNVMSDAADEYDVVVVDTAPTGHTLRLLALPQFLDGLLGKLIKLRMKLSGLTSTLQAFLGDSGARERAQTIDNAMDRLEQFRERISNLEKNLKDNSKTSFLVVTIPTKLAVDESKRLVAELTSQGIAVNNVVVNQCLGKTDGTLLNLCAVISSNRGGRSLSIGFSPRLSIENKQPATTKPL
jgi:arsenite-transporting ATPase